MKCDGLEEHKNQKVHLEMKKTNRTEITKTKRVYIFGKLHRLAKIKLDTDNI